MHPHTLNNLEPCDLFPPIAFTHFFPSISFSCIHASSIIRLYFSLPVFISWSLSVTTQPSKSYFLFYFIMRVCMRELIHICMNPIHNKSGSQQANRLSLHVCLSVCMYVCMYVCLSLLSWHAIHVYWYFSEEANID